MHKATLRFNRGRLFASRFIGIKSQFHHSLLTCQSITVVLCNIGIAKIFALRLAVVNSANANILSGLVPLVQEQCCKRDEFSSKWPYKTLTIVPCTLEPYEVHLCTTKLQK